MLAPISRHLWVLFILGILHLTVAVQADRREEDSLSGSTPSGSGAHPVAWAVNTHSDLHRDSLYARADPAADPSAQNSPIPSQAVSLNADGDESTDPNDFDTKDDFNEDDIDFNDFDKDDKDKDDKDDKKDKKKDGDKKDDEKDQLPIEPSLTTGWILSGVFLLLSGAIFTFWKNTWSHACLSIAYLTAVAVTVLILYVMAVPVPDSKEIGYTIAVIVASLVLGGVAVLFRNLAEGVACIVGGFSFSMWLLTLTPGGLIPHTATRIVFIAVFSLAPFALTFTKWTREWIMLLGVAFAGSTAIVLGIDCFSRAGLKEFWAYVWDVNADLFPKDTKTYPVTKGIRVETAAIIVLALAGTVIQLKLWQIMKAKLQGNDGKGTSAKQPDIEEDPVTSFIVKGTSQENLPRNGLPSSNSSVTYNGNAGSHKSYENGADNMTHVHPTRSYETAPAAHNYDPYRGKEFEQGPGARGPSPATVRNNGYEAAAANPYTNNSFDDQNNSYLNVPGQQSQNQPNIQVTPPQVYGPRNRTGSDSSEDSIAKVSNSASVYSSDEKTLADGPEQNGGMVPATRTLSRTQRTRRKGSSGRRRDADELFLSTPVARNANSVLLDSGLQESLKNASVEDNEPTVLATIAEVPQTPADGRNQPGSVVRTELKDCDSENTVVGEEKTKNAVATVDGKEESASAAELADTSILSDGSSTSSKDRAPTKTTEGETLPRKHHVHFTTTQSQPTSPAKEDHVTSTAVTAAAAAELRTEGAEVPPHVPVTDDDLTSQISSSHEKSVANHSHTSSQEIVAPTVQSLSKEFLPREPSRMTLMARTTEWVEGVREADIPESLPIETDSPPAVPTPSPTASVALSRKPSLKRRGSSAGSGKLSLKNMVGRNHGGGGLGSAISRSSGLPSAYNLPSVSVLLGKSARPTSELNRATSATSMRRTVLGVMPSVATITEESETSNSSKASSLRRPSDSSEEGQGGASSTQPSTLHSDSEDSNAEKKKQLRQQQQQQPGTKKPWNRLSPLTIPENKSTVKLASALETPKKVEFKAVTVLDGDEDDMPLNQRKTLIKQRQQERVTSSVEQPTKTPNSTGSLMDKLGLFTSQVWRSGTPKGPTAFSTLDGNKTPLTASHTLEQSARLALFRQSVQADLAAGSPIIPPPHSAQQYGSGLSRLGGESASSPYGSANMRNREAEVQRAIDQQRSLLLGQKQAETKRRDQARWAKEETERMMEEKMRRGSMQDAHRQALRKMQAEVKA